MKIFILGILLIFLIPITVHGTADGPDHWSVTGVASWDVLNIRVKPHYKAMKVGSIPYNGNCVQNLGCEGGLTIDEYATLSPKQRKKLLKKRPVWCKVNYKNTLGWVNGKYLQEGSCPY